MVSILFCNPTLQRFRPKSWNSLCFVLFRCNTFSKSAPVSVSASVSASVSEPKTNSDTERENSCFQSSGVLFSDFWSRIGHEDDFQLLKNRAVDAVDGTSQHGWSAWFILRHDSCGQCLNVHQRDVAFVSFLNPLELKRFAVAYFQLIKYFNSWCEDIFSIRTS